MKLIRNRQLAAILQAFILSLLLLAPANSLSLEALTFTELSALEKVRNREALLLQEAADSESELDQTEIQAIKSITAARKMKKTIERRGMTPSPELYEATKPMLKKVEPDSKTRSDLLQLDE